jgi:histidinol-phosphatase
MTDRSSPSVAEDLELALRLADEASNVALDFFARGGAGRAKADGTVVTDADHAVERMLSAALAGERPTDGILGEEFGATGQQARRWILDPIDGTKNFVAGRDDWGVHIALEDGGEIVAGVVTRPLRAMRWWAARGCGAHTGGIGGVTPPTPLRVSRQERLADARVSGWLVDDHRFGPALKALPGWTESLDLDAIIHVAEGRLDALIDGTASRIWDRAPFVILLDEAGGRYRDHVGTTDLSLAGGRFTNGAIDAALAGLLRT